MPGDGSRLESEQALEPANDIRARSARADPVEIRRNVGTVVLSGPERNSDGSNQAFVHLFDVELERLPFELSGNRNRADSRRRRYLEENGTLWRFLMLPARN